MIMVISWLKNHKIILFSLFIFVVSIIFINPLREAPIDDDWAYVLTVKNYVDTGHYVLHPWAAANFPFQVVWGSVFSKIIGFSYSSLRISTLVLTFFGMVGLYLFARELKINRNVSGLLALLLIACPLFLKFSLSFMTDIPFLSLFVLSAFLYWRAFSRDSLYYAFAASLICAAATFTRQLGISLLGSVILYGLVYFRQKVNIKFVILGLTLPCMALVWQIQAAFFNPNWGMEMVKEAQRLYFANYQGVFVNLLIRPAYILIYLSLFCLPFIFVLIRYIRNKLNFKVLFLVSAYVIISLLVGKLIWNTTFTFPYIPWAFGDVVPWDPLLLKVIVTFCLLFAAILFGASILPVSQRIKKDFYSGGGTVFVFLIFGSLLIYTLLFYKLGDEYLLIFVPFILLLFGYSFQTYLKNKRLFLLIFCSAIVSIAISTVRVKNDLVHGEVYWKSCETLRISGIPIKDISCNWMWISYYSYQAYIDETIGVKHSNLNDFFKRWLPERELSTQYIVTSTPQLVKGKTTVISAEPYGIYILKREK